MDDERRPADRPRRTPIREEQTPLWRQALDGIGLVALAGLGAVAVGVLMAVVVSWLF